MKINLSQVLAIHLEEKVHEGWAKRWQEENKDILDGYNRHFEQYGCLSDEFRDF